MTRARILALALGLFLLLLPAHAAVKKGTIQIKVLDSETHSVVLDDSGVPKNCDPTNYDAYCHSSRTAAITNTLLVQEDNQAPYHIRCTADAKFSRCVPLQTGATLEARRDKNGLLVYYVDEEGKVRKQLYRVVETGARSSAAAGTQDAAPQSAGAGNNAPVNKPSEPAAPVGANATSETVKCNFSSTPSGAEITIDGRFVGNTPSVVGLTVGTHAVGMSLAGFAHWKRDLTVSPESELTVNAVLEKGQ